MAPAPGPPAPPLPGPSAPPVPGAPVPSAPAPPPAQQTTATSTAGGSRTFPTITANLVPDTVQQPVAVWALERLRKGEFVAYDYFTRAGLEAARHTRLTAVAEATDLGNLQAVVDEKTGSLALTAMSTNAKPNPRARSDYVLSLPEITQGKKVFLSAMQDTGWPIGIITAFADLITELETHEAALDNPTFGEQALVTYFADIRREFHAAVASGAREFANIAVVNQTRLRNIVIKLETAANEKARQAMQDATASVWGSISVSVVHTYAQYLC